MAQDVSGGIRRHRFKNRKPFKISGSSRPTRSIRRHTTMSQPVATDQVGIAISSKPALRVVDNCACTQEGGWPVDRGLVDGRGVREGSRKDKHGVMGRDRHLGVTTANRCNSNLHTEVVTVRISVPKDTRCNNRMGRVFVLAATYL